MIQLKSILKYSIYIAMCIMCLLFIIPCIMGIKPYIVTSGSMSPAITTGSIVYIDTKAHDIRQNDVIAFKLQDGTVVTHRVVEKKNEVYITKGDANNTEDISPVSERNIIGKNILTIPYIGTICQILDTYKSTLICILIAYILYTEFFKTKKINEEKIHE